MLLDLNVANAIVSAVLEAGAAKNLPPLAVGVIDGRGALKAFQAQNGTSLKRGELAIAKGAGVLALGMGGQALAKRAEEQAYFIAAASHVVGGALLPVRGGVLLKDDAGQVVGAIGVSGAASEDDEACALAGAEAVGLKAVP